ncbi:glycosyltransferase family 2 protein [Paenibacillus sp. HJGM_3]|uniref:glycosyltransferase family 2 protein n=1 Tax=Paenibacillus sp. HJGM_3 TaxID=3379816 RepID=UPI00385F5EFA
MKGRKRKRTKPGAVLGREHGYRDGTARGIENGRRAGFETFQAVFPGTSIVIPTYNQLDVLRECIASIEAYTDLPHEIIVVDNASEDGTAEYLRSMAGRVRVRLNPTNAGFAGAINQGLMMAKGTTILLLNNDTVVTRSWLGNLLAVLNSSPKIGLVGPVTNYIGNDVQLIPTRYRTMEEMQAFAGEYNRTDPSKWTITGRLTGFCVLMRRETFRRVGYLDEGFEVGNFEDDDFGLRVRLLGLDLVVAKDTFIHHYGSVSMRTLGSQLKEVNGRNSAFYANKWAGQQNTLLPTPVAIAESVGMLHMYPTGVLVRGAAPTLYWIERGVRHPVESETGLPYTRLSQIDLANWPIGPSVSAAQVKERVHGAGSGGDRPFAEGALLSSPDGAKYQYKSGRLHRFMGDMALSAWNMTRRETASVSEEDLKRHEHGEWIVAPPVLRADNL